MGSHNSEGDLTLKLENENVVYHDSIAAILLLPRLPGLRYKQPNVELEMKLQIQAKVCRFCACQPWAYFAMVSIPLVTLHFHKHMAT